MPVGSIVEFSLQRLNRAVTWLALGWVAAVLCSLAWMVWDEQHRTRDWAQPATRVSQEEDNERLRVHLLGGVAAHLILGGLGLAGLFIGRRQMAEALRERLGAEEARRNAEQRWQAALESAGDGLWDWNVETDEVFFSEGWQRMLGESKTGLRPHVDEWKSRVHPEDLSEVLAAVKRHLDGDTPTYESQHRLRCQDGSYKWVLDRGRVIARGPDGRARRMIGTHSDITAHRLLEAQLRESWEQYHALFERNPIPFWVYDEQTLEMLAVNEAAVRHYGYSRHEFLALTLRDLYPAAEWTRWEKVVAEGVTEVAPGGPWRQRRQSGDEILVEVACSRVNWRGRKARCAQNLDVTARRQAEAGLAESESRYRTLVEVSPYCIHEIDLEGRMTSINAAGLQMLGLSAAAQVKGRAYLDFVAAAERERVAGLLSDAREGRASEFEYTGVGGSVFLSTFVPVLGPTGQALRLTGVTQDITQRRATEAALRAHERELELFFNQSIDGFAFMMLEAPVAWAKATDKEVLLDYVMTHERVTRANDALLAQFGATREAYLGLTPAQIMAHDLATGRELWRQLYEEGRCRAEFAGRKVDGTEVWIEGDYTCLHDEAGRITGHFGVQRDVTPRKHAEAALSRSQARLARAMEFGRMGWWEYDGNAQEYTFNDQFYALLGTTAANEGGYRMSAATYLREFAIPTEAAQQTLPAERLSGAKPPGEEWELEHTLRRRDGRMRHLHLRVTAITDQVGRVTGARGVATDITERVEMEAERRMLSRAVEQSPVTIVITDARGAIEYANPQFTKVTGYALPEVLGKNPRVLKSGAHPESFFREMWQTISAGRDWRGELCNRRKDGTLFWEEVSISPVINEGGAITHYLAVKEDITAHRESIARIREQAELLNVTRDAILVVGVDARVRYWNRGAELLYGWSQAEAVGRVLDTLIYDETRPASEEARRAIVERDEWSGELRQRTKSGVTVVVRSRCMLMRDPSGLPRSILVTSSDVTEAKRMESQILRTQRLESVGALAVGVAHDLNNVFSPILMSVELMRPLALTTQDREVVRLMSDSARRGADVVRQLLIFGRGSEAPHEVMQVVPVVKEIVRMMRETFPRNLTIEGPTSRSLWPIRGHATQIYQVLLNLCVNARDAMPQGGRLTVLAENLQLDEAAARVQPGGRPGRFVRLTVADTGVGVPPEIMDRIFDPFFTTKPQGQGTGLGLSTVVGIAKSHGGFVTVTSRVGEGSQFCVFLAATGDEHEGAAAVDVDSHLRGHGETILLIDDEMSIRVILGRALVQAGYRTVLAANGDEALRLARERVGDLRAAVVDMMMPGIDGVQTIRALRQIAPELPVVGCSGIDRYEAELATLGFARLKFLRKPFAVGDLLTALRAELEGPKPAGNAPPH